MIFLNTYKNKKFPLLENGGYPAILLESFLKNLIFTDKTPSFINFYNDDFFNFFSASLFKSDSTHNFLLLSALLKDYILLESEERENNIKYLKEISHYINNDLFIKVIIKLSDDNDLKNGLYHSYINKIINFDFFSKLIIQNEKSILSDLQLIHQNKYLLNQIIDFLCKQIQDPKDINNFCVKNKAIFPYHYYPNFEPLYSLDILKTIDFIEYSDKKIDIINTIYQKLKILVFDNIDLSSGNLRLTNVQNKSNFKELSFFLINDINRGINIDLYLPYLSDLKSNSFFISKHFFITNDFDYNSFHRGSSIDALSVANDNWELLSDISKHDVIKHDNFIDDCLRCSLPINIDLKNHLCSKIQNFLFDDNSNYINNYSNWKIKYNYWLSIVDFKSISNNDLIKKFVFTHWFRVRSHQYSIEDDESNLIWNLYPQLKEKFTYFLNKHDDLSFIKIMFMSLGDEHLNLWKTVESLINDIKPDVPKYYLSNIFITSLRTLIDQNMLLYDNELNIEGLYV